MNTVNQVMLVGRIGKAPEFRVYGPGSKGLTKFSLATDRRGDKDKTDWHYVTCFGQDAVFAKDFLGVGDLVCIQGRIEVNKSDDGKTYTDIVADRVTSLVSKAKESVEPADDGPLPF